MFTHRAGARQHGFVRPAIPELLVRPANAGFVKPGDPTVIGVRMFMEHGPRLTMILEWGQILLGVGNEYPPGQVLAVPVLFSYPAIG